MQILDGGFGAYSNEYADTKGCYNLIVKHMRLELGVHVLVDTFNRNLKEELFTWFENVQEIDHWLDCLEISLLVIERVVRRDWASFSHTASLEPDEVISGINGRLQEAGIGYQFVSGEIVRIDSTLIHSEIVVPALSLLGEARFIAADQEYRAAHEAYRHGRLEDCIASCGKAFESVLKVLGAGRGWGIRDGDTASTLINAAVKARFLASYSQASLNNLVGLLQSSTPTVRNNAGGHGAGAAPRVVPAHLAALQLHQTAATIIYLVEQDKALANP
jgi:AbiJ N-terminal domain 4